MAIFNFGNKQRLHTQLLGNTTGREMFKVDEYNSVKKLSFILGFVMFVLFTTFYFCWNSIVIKIRIFMILIFIGCAIWTYFNLKHQTRVRDSLY